MSGYQQSKKRKTLNEMEDVTDIIKSYAKSLGSLIERGGDDDEYVWWRYHGCNVFDAAFCSDCGNYIGCTKYASDHVTCKCSSNISRLLFT